MRHDSRLACLRLAKKIKVIRAPRVAHHRQKLAKVRYDDTYFKLLVADSLEAGLAYPDAARLAAAVFKEVDIAARDENNNHNLLPPTALEDIRLYCRAILRSGTTFSAWEVAKRAVGAWKEAGIELSKLHDEWRRETVRAKVRRQYVRRKARAVMTTVEGSGQQPQQKQEAQKTGLSKQRLGPLSDLRDLVNLPSNWDDGHWPLHSEDGIGADVDLDDGISDDDEPQYLDFDFYRETGNRRLDEREDV